MSAEDVQTNDAELVATEVVVVAQPEDLQARVDELEARLAGLEEGLPDTWLLSQSLWKRVITVYGYYLVVALVIALPIFICTFTFMMIGIVAAAVGGDY